VDTKQLDASLAGRAFDLDFLAALPHHADPCGENGEFHTLAVAGPMFGYSVRVRPGEVVARDRFVFADFEADAAPELAS
jgi:diphthamide synthase (EF-2-diphthine--ammonia ligase)